MSLVRRWSGIKGSATLAECLEQGGQTTHIVVPGALPKDFTHGTAAHQRAVVEKYGAVAMRFGCEAGWYVGTFVRWPCLKKQRARGNVGINAVLQFAGERPKLYRLEWESYLVPELPAEHSWVFIEAVDLPRISGVKRARDEPEPAVTHAARCEAAADKRMQDAVDLPCLGMYAAGKLSRGSLVTCMEKLVRDAEDVQHRIDKLLLTPASRKQRRFLSRSGDPPIHPLVSLSWQERYTAHVDIVAAAFRFKVERRLRAQLHKVLTKLAVKIRANLFTRKNKRGADVHGLLARCITLRATKSVISGPVRALLDLAARRGLCKCVSGTLERDVVWAEAPLKSRAPRAAETQRWHGEARRVGTSYEFTSLEGLLQFLPVEYVFNDESDWPFYHVMAGAYMPFEEEHYTVRMDDPIPSGGAQRGAARDEYRGDLQQLRLDLRRDVMEFKDRWALAKPEMAKMKAEARSDVPHQWLRRDIQHLLLWPKGPGSPVNRHVLTVKALSITPGSGSFVISLRSSGIMRVSFWTQAYRRCPGSSVMTLSRRRPDTPSSDAQVAAEAKSGYATSLARDLYVPMPTLRSVRVLRKAQAKASGGAQP